MFFPQRSIPLNVGNIPITAPVLGRFQLRPCINVCQLNNRYASTLSKEEIYKIVDSVNNTKQWATLGNNAKVRNFILDNFSKSSDSNARALLQLKRKMVRCFNQRYSIALKYICEGLPTESDRLKFSSEFLLYVGPKKYQYFVGALSSIINDEQMSRNEKLRELYKYIEIHGKLNPNVTKTSGILLPNDIHKWFYNNVSKEQRIQHYIFLVDNSVKLSGHYAELMHNILLHGSQTEFYVVSFQHFLDIPGKADDFERKFHLIHSFKSMKRIIDLLIKKKKFKYMKQYLGSLTLKLEELESRSSKLKNGGRSNYFIEFLQTLQSFARASNNIEMFMEIMKSVADVISTKTPARIVRKSFAEVLTYFQGTGNTESAFKIMSLLNFYPITKSNSTFTNELLGRIIFSLRQYKDPKLSASYLLRTYNLVKTRALLNDLGLWCLIFEGKFGHLENKVVTSETFREKAISINIPTDLHMTSTPDWVALNELYIVTFDYHRGNLSKEEYRELILNCYQSYTTTLKNSLPIELKQKLDTSVLKSFLHTIKYDLLDDKLAYNILMHFFSLEVKPRLTRDNTPFGLVLYQNRSISQQEFNNVLELMQKLNEPMDHKIIITLVQRFLQSGNIESAHQWYQRLLASGYSLRHYSLIQAAIKNSWEVPDYAIKYLRESDIDDNFSEEILDDECLQDSMNCVHDEKLLQLAESLANKMSSKEA